MFTFRTRVGLVLLVGLSGLCLNPRHGRANDALKQALRQQVENVAGYLASDRSVDEVRLSPDKGAEHLAEAVAELLLQCKPPIRTSLKAKHELRIRCPGLLVADAGARKVEIHLEVRDAGTGKGQNFLAQVRGEHALPPRDETARSDALARKILEYLAETKESEVKILPPMGPRGSCNLKMQLDLVADIGRISGEKVKVSEGAKLTFHCTYSIEKAEQGIVYKFTGAFLDANNVQVKVVTTQKTDTAPAGDNNLDPATLAIVSGGVTGELEPNSDNTNRMKSVPDLALSPTGIVDMNGVARGAPKSPYGVQFLVNKGLRAVKADRGILSTHFDKGDTYSVLLRNDSDHDACVTLWIDGLNMFHFSEEGKAFNLLVPKGKSASVPGWFITKTASKQFEVMSLEKTPAGKQRLQPARVGTVTAAFSRAYGLEEVIPEDEYALRARINQSGENATGLGRDIAAEYRAVPRYVGAVRCAVTVRYTP